MPNLTCKYGNTKLVAYRDYELNIRELGKSRKLQCPECGKAVFLKKGGIKIAHFAHFPDKESQNCSRINESQEHFECKNYIAQLLESRYSASRVFPEHKLESGQEADVLLELPNIRVAFEIQFSQQVQIQWETRSNLYREQKIEPVWILGFRKDIEDLKREDGGFVISTTAQNAGIGIPLIYDLEKYVALQPYVKEYQQDKTHLFHVITCIDKKIEFYLGYLRQGINTKTFWYGEFLPIVSDWDFLETENRFMPDIEKFFNLRYIEKQKTDPGYREHNQNGNVQGIFDENQRLRWELMDKSNKHRINGGVAETVEKGVWEQSIAQETLEHTG